MNQAISKRRRSVAPDVGSGSMISDEVLLLEILVRLPVKSLVRFKSVCKAWCATIASPHFVRLHLELARASSSSMVLVPRKYQPEPTKVVSRFVHIYSFQPSAQSKVAKLIFMYEPRPNGIPMFKIPLHCDGLILIPSITAQGTYLCATRPPRSLSSCRRAPGMCRWTKGSPLASILPVVRIRWLGTSCAHTVKDKYVQNMTLDMRS